MSGRVGLGLVVAFGLGAGAAAQEMTLPSGLTVAFHDAIVEDQSDGARLLTLRYISPRINRESGDLRYPDVSGDLDWLCDNHGLSSAASADGVDEVIITLMDRAVERGAPDPDATMFIGAYRPTEEGCEWQ